MISSNIQISGKSHTPDRSVQAPAETQEKSPFNDVLNGLSSKPDAHTKQSRPSEAAPDATTEQPVDQPEEMVASATHAENTPQDPDQATGGLPATGEMAGQLKGQMKGGKLLPMGGNNAPLEPLAAREPGFALDTITVTSARSTTLANQDSMELTALPEIDTGHRLSLSPTDRLPTRDGLVQVGAGYTATETAAAASKTDAAARGAESQATMRSAAGDAGWGEEVRNRINWFNRNGVQKAELRLHPAELGSLEIRITTDNDQASIVFYSQNRAARELMEAEMPRLRELFAETGIELSQSDVSEQSLAQQDSDASDDAGTRSTGGSGTSEDSSTETFSSPGGAETGAHSGLIDYYI